MPDLHVHAVCNTVSCTMYMDYALCVNSNLPIVQVVFVDNYRRCDLFQGMCRPVVRSLHRPLYEM